MNKYTLLYLFALITLAVAQSPSKAIPNDLANSASQQTADTKQAALESYQQGGEGEVNSQTKNPPTQVTSKAPPTKEQIASASSLAAASAASKATKAPPSGEILTAAAQASEAAAKATASLPSPTGAPGALANQEINDSAAKVVATSTFAIVAVIMAYLL